MHVRTKDLNSEKNPERVVKSIVNLVKGMVDDEGGRLPSPIRRRHQNDHLRHQTCHIRHQIISGGHPGIVRLHHNTE